MPTCTCGSITITCPAGCGCFCAGEIDCTQWCEPVQVEAAFENSGGVRKGGVSRIIKNSDGTDRLYINASVTEPGADLPRHPRGTRLRGCAQGSTLESMALVLGALHGLEVTVPPERAHETIDERVTGTLDEIASRYGLIVGASAS